MRLKVSRVLVTAGLLAAAMLQAAAAQQHNITIDRSFGSPTTLIGPNYEITANLGKQVGSNLFQSFGKFGLTSSESATFSGPAAVSNVIGRVTGGALSNIDGKIASTITGASLYLINPSGIVFGPNATVNVSGGFHASTADYLRMSDGAKFQATNPDASTLSAASPEAFGFLTAQPAKITVNGSSFGVPSRQTLGLVGGPVSIKGGTLSAPAGTINVTSAAGAGEVPVDPRNTAALTVTSFGPVHIKGNSTLDVSNADALGSGGSVLIRSGALTIDASEINADNYGSDPGGVISLRGDKQITLSNGAYVHAVAMGSGNGADVLLSTASSRVISADASTVLTDTLGPGNGGSITIVAGQLALRNGTNVLAQSSGSGSGGDVIVSLGGSLTVDSGASLGTLAVADGSAGNVSVIVVGPITIDMSVGAAASMFQGIASQTIGSGNAGNVTVTAGTLSIVNNGEIESVTGASGKAGDVSVTAFDTLTIDGSGAIPPPNVGPTGILSAAQGSGAAGIVSVSAGILSIINSGEIATSTFASGDAGDTTVAVSGQLTIDGSKGDPKTGVTGILSQAERGSSGAAGTVSVSAGALSIINSGEIATSTFASGNAGVTRVAVSGQLTIDGSKGDPNTGVTGILSQAEPGSSGAAGMVSVSAGTLSIINSGVVSAITFASRAAGSVTVAVSGQLTIDGSGENLAVSRTGIFSQTQGSGAAGTVSVDARRLVIANDGVISSRTLALGDGGNVSITSGSLAIVRNGSIATDTRGSGSGKAGDVSVNVAGRLTIDGVSQTSFTGISSRSIQGSNGNAGQVTVGAGSLSIDNGGAISTEAEGLRSTASGGNITLHVRDLLYLVGSEITTSVKGETGNGGNIAIDPQFVILNHSSIIAQAVEGHGGNITITAGQFIPSSDSIISATSQLGISGSLVINGPLVDVNGALVVLSTQLRSRIEVLREACAARGDRPISSLVERGRGGLPQDPEATLPALYVAGRDLNTDPQNAVDTKAASGALYTTVHLTMQCG